MADQTTDQPPATSRALAEPTVHVRHGWVAGLGLGSLGMWMASYTPLQVLLPLQLQHITPHHKIVALAIVTGFGAIASGLATPLAGALSDRTTHRYALGRLTGRRHRWTLIMAVLGAISLFAISQVASVLAVTVLWVLFSAFQNGEYASLSAAIPDHVPVRQRATVAGWVGMPQALGLVVGTLLVVAVFTGQTSGYLVLAVVLAVSVLPFVLLTPDYPLESEHRAPLSWRQLGRSYWISPRDYPDFAWAWVTRFLVSLAIAMGTLYLLYFLRDKIHYARLFPGQDASDGLLILIVIYTVGVVITAIVGGMISDRMGRRKMIVTVSGVLIAGAALLLTFVETWTASIVAAAVFGVGFGAYLAVDQALITQVLPAARDRAKDLGVINIAIVCPSAIGALIAAPLVSLGGYPTLFAGTAIVGFLGSILVWRIKSVP
ncbi:MAG TPA: MFS transporter [Streptosporangiaceae bacterium]|nr:MFS transporter [Streptosporangiaceae bacterium]